MGGNNLKNNIKSNIKNKIIKKIEIASEYKTYIITAIILFGVLFIAYKLSHSYRISKLLYDMRKMDAYLNIKSKLNYEDIRNLNLGDFYISSAYRPYMGNNQMFEYCDLKVTEKIIKSGARCMYVDIFNSNMGYGADPVISTGYKEGQWKLTLNTILFDDFCKLLAYGCFSAGYVSNYTDPFILLLNLNTNGNIDCLNKIKKIIYKRLKRYLLDNRYTFSSTNIMKKPIKDFMKKIIIMSSSGYQNSELEELINFTWDREELKMITYESLDTHILDPSVIKLDPYELKQFNKDNMTIVTPNTSTVFTYNYNPDIFWGAGCQFVCINYQKIDNNFDTYISNFRTESFIAKPLSQRGSGSKEKINLQSSPISSSGNNADDPYNYQNERCPELPEEDEFDESALINYKDFGAQHGLCFPSKTSVNCHCDNHNDDNNADGQCYFYKYGTLGPEIGKKAKENLCCANNRIVPPIPLYKKNADGTNMNTVSSDLQYISKIQCTPGTEESYELEHGKDKFDKSDKSGESKMWLCPIESEVSIDNKHICLIDQNNNNKCPKGWDYDAKIKDTREKICCRNT